MNRSATIALCFTALLCLPASVAFAQNAPPTYEADPSVYKIIFEDQNFRVISATWKVGVTDKSHSHTAPSVGYFVTDCAGHYYLFDVDAKTGTVREPDAQPLTLARGSVAQNVADILCARESGHRGDDDDDD